MYVIYIDIILIDHKEEGGISINNKRMIEIIIFSVVTLVVMIGVWANDGYRAMEVAYNALEDSKEVEVNNNENIVFYPIKEESEIGFIFYPGGRVDPVSYAPLMKRLGKEGYKSVIVKMPLDLAVLDYNEADKVIMKHPDIKKWIIGGHSLGGAMAARYTNNNPENISGLILLASYPSESDNLSNFNMEVTSIYGDEDGIANKDKILNSKDLLPEDTKWMRIEGGNHSQFGWYGFQEGDNEASISRRKQQDIIATSILEFMESVKSTLNDK